MAETTPGTGTEVRDWGQWTAQNGRNLVVGAVVVAALGAAFWWYRVTQDRKEAFASQALERARGAAESGNLPFAASELARVHDRFVGTRAGDQAAILLAQVRLTQGQVAEGVNGLQSFVAGRHADYVEASAYSLLGSGLEDQGKLREAADAYRRASESARLDFLKAGYLIDAGRVLAAVGDTAGARAALGEVLEKYGELDQSSEARVRMGELGGVAPPLPRTSRPRS